MKASRQAHIAFLKAVSILLPRCQQQRLGRNEVNVTKR